MKSPATQGLLLPDMNALPRAARLHTHAEWPVVLLQLILWSAVASCRRCTHTGKLYRDAHVQRSLPAQPPHLAELVSQAMLRSTPPDT